MCAALASAHVRAVAENPADAARRHSRAKLLFEKSDQEHNDRDGTCFFGVRTGGVSAAASKLAQHRMDAPQSVVRGESLACLAPQRSIGARRKCVRRCGSAQALLNAMSAMGKPAIARLTEKNRA